MERLRVLSKVEDSWGAATIFKTFSEIAPIAIKSQQKVSRSNADMRSKQNITQNNTSASGIPDNIENKDTHFKRLSYLEASLCATIVEDIITQLRILDAANNELHIHRIMSEMGLLRALKYGVEQPTNKGHELEGIHLNDLGGIKYKLDKLDADRKFMIRALTDLYMELALHFNYETIEETVNAILIRNEHFKFLTDDEGKHRIKRRDLNKQLRQQRNHVKSVIYDSDVHIQQLNTQVEDAVLNAECRSRYVENWQRARTEQNRQTIKDRECNPITSIEFFKSRYEHEQRVHSEVELLVNIMINETLGKVEIWMGKYDTDIEDIDLKIQIKKCDYQRELDRRVALEETIELHEKLMKDWIHFKEEREKARQYREKMTKSAITVQAWWRGLLVRLQLGPYKVVKKKGGAAKKKK